MKESRAARDALLVLRGSAVIDLLALGDEGFHVGEAILQRGGRNGGIMGQHIVDGVFEPQVREVLGEAHLSDVLEMF